MFFAFQNQFTFSAYVQSLGLILLQWCLPVGGCVYLAVRLGVQHGIKAFVAERERIVAPRSTPAPRLPL